MKKVCFITTISSTISSFILEFAKFMHENGDYDITFICDKDENFSENLPDYAPLINQIKRFATEHDLKIVSVFFWHIWADQVIECSALQFSTYIKNAEYVFTTTFHGAVFTMLNHKKCCIYPYREKVKSIVF